MSFERGRSGQRGRMEPSMSCQICGAKGDLFAEVTGQPACSICTIELCRKYADAREDRSGSPSVEPEAREYLPTGSLPRSTANPREIAMTQHFLFDKAVSALESFGIGTYLQSARARQ